MDLTQERTLVVMLAHAAHDVYYAAPAAGLLVAFALETWRSSRRGPEPADDARRSSSQTLAPDHAGGRALDPSFLHTNVHEVSSMAQTTNVSAQADPVASVEACLTTAEELRAVVPPPKPDGVVWRKSLDRLEEHSRRFIELSPMLFIATADADGTCDCSPRGDRPGFVKVLDDRTLLIPDRKGNRRIDTMRNIVSNPHAGLIFLVPGTAETLRVNGRASITDNEELLAKCAVDGKRPLLGIVVRIEELFMHCARAFNRSLLWDATTWPERSELPTLGKILSDQLPELGIDAAEADAGLERANRDLY